VVEELDCFNVLELIKLGAFNLAEDTPHLQRHCHLARPSCWLKHRALAHRFRH
jgi:hypothetical protein